MGGKTGGSYRLDIHGTYVQPMGLDRCTGGGARMRTRKRTKPTPKHPKNGPYEDAKSLKLWRRGNDYSGLQPSPLRGRRQSRRSARPAVACRTSRLMIEGSNPPSIIHRKRGARPLFLWMAEREGFEPSIRDYRIHTFQACSFNHSDTSPDLTAFLPCLTGREESGTTGIVPPGGSAQG